MNRLQQPPSELLVLEPFAGLCRIELRTYVSSGKDPGTNPGIGIDCYSTLTPIIHNGEHLFGMGVLSRDDAAKLRDFLEVFIKENL